MTLRILLAIAASGVVAALAPPLAAADAVPDVVVAGVQAPAQVLSGHRFSIDVAVRERSGTAGGIVTATVSSGGVVLASAPVALDPGGSASARVELALTASPGPAKVDVAVGASTASATIEVTDFQVYAPGWRGPAIAGHGGQFNQNVYAAISRADGVDERNVRTMERSVSALRPQFSRIFFSQAAFSDPDLMESFVKTVLFAQRSGATIDVTWQGGTLDVKSGTVPKFADVLIDLVQKRHVTALRWLTIQNEPNSTRMTTAQYEAAYRALDPYIQSIRGQVRYMGGDLVRGESGATGQRAWFSYMATHMSDLLDAYSVHIFWDYWDTEKLEERLTEVRQIVDALPEAGRKPVYVSEYGVRGLRTFQGKPAGDPGVWVDGTPIGETNAGAFQHAWFDLLAGRLGYAGTSKWDLYFGRYDKATQSYSTVGGPKSGWPRHPLYNLLWLLTATVKPGWQAVELDAVPETSRLVASYAGPAGQWTLLGLDRAGGQLNTPASTLVPYSIGGLPPSTGFRLVLWNETGDGLISAPAPVRTDAAGVAAFSVPQHAVFALTTVTGVLWPRSGFPVA